MAKKRTPAPSLFDTSLLDTAAGLDIVQATFVAEQRSSFTDLLQGYTTMRVLTYSNSVGIVTKAAEALDELEIIFGREDILKRMEQYFFFQE